MRIQRNEDNDNGDSDGKGEGDIGIVLESERDLDKMNKLMDFFNRNVDPSLLEEEMVRYRENAKAMNSLNIKLKKRAEKFRVQLNEQL